MDTSAVNINITVDDFDSVLSYETHSAWETPDPSSSDFDAANSQWLMGTYHKTSVVNTTLSFNFTAPALYIFGASGPDYGSYEVVVDSVSSKFSAYATQNASSPYLLYGSSELSYDNHTLQLRNLGAANSSSGGNFLFDFLRFTVQLAPSGATVSNTTLQEDDSSITYTGTWDNNTSANFSGGGSAYTNEDGASFGLDFHASAIYIFGDKKNDHGLYNVTLSSTDGSTVETYDGISGCGGAYGQTCEQQHPTLAYFASNLDNISYHLKLVNDAGVNGSYFDLDSIVLTIPSVYAPRNLSSTSTSTSTSTIGSASATSSTGGGNASNGAAAALLASNPVVFIALFSLWLFRFWRN
ncbi:hypothetical protein FISHEDRAFT_60598 [Fistulina hepatica ATCC 64428]|uniref:Uncharacterized protein n=1 Tax=Fistulina hepatica ATCC 64428 TaxID=1128425 RepID=A0A0D7A5M0_9AGAR|nr:hypothetical protein FISHEDRAFT_60598 [Fistulina hepatica ATCC 64428]